MKNEKSNVKELKEKALLIRRDIIREVFYAGSGHPGGSLSSADILSTLYFNILNIDPKDPKKKDRDIFVLSKGHAAPALYAALAEKGFFDTEKLTTLRKTGSMLQGHPSMKVPGVEMATGSLGQGFSGAVGFSLAAKTDKSERRVYSLLGDGELQEGIVWEAAMAASHYKLDNLCVIIDHNGLQIDGKNDDVMRVMPIDEKFKAFGWNVIKTDGHDIEGLLKAFDAAKNCKGRPSCIIAETHKGQGVSFMKDDPSWHGKAPNREQAELAMKELGGTL